MTKKKTKNQPVFQHDFFDTTSVTNFVFKKTGKAPAGYPKQVKLDKYSWVPFKGKFEERKEAYIKHCLKNPAGENIKGFFYELVRIYKNKGPVHTSIITGALHYIDERYDCSDFVMLGIMRMLYQLSGHKLLSKKINDESIQTLLNFKYWPDEPGIDSMCYWTENHQIMFSCNEYLAGQYMPEKIFSNSGMTGLEKMEKARPRILQWLELRYKTGFSEWLSHIYYDEDITALLNLIDFCHDKIIAQKAAIVLDLIFLDMALNTFHGAFQSSHGRSYSKEKQDASCESTIDTSKLIFGMGVFSGADNMSAVSLALSENYQLPAVIEKIASDYNKNEMINKQRMSIKLNEAKKWGLNPKKWQDALVLLSLEAYLDPITFRSTIKLFDRFQWWENQFFIDFKKNKWLINFLRYSGMSSIISRIIKKDVTRNTREEVNIYSYRTADYLISSAQDYRKGFGGDQQHIWQASFSPDAVCFTTHPGHGEDSSAGYWIGSGTLPRVAQHKNVVVAVYKISKMPGIYMTNKIFYTHAWLPKSSFDEVTERGGWIFARKGKGYVALFSQHGYRWQDEGEYAGKEVIADNIENIWICEMGSENENGTFESFIKGICRAKIKFKGLKVKYASPSQGLLKFGWRGPFRKNGKFIDLHNYARYDNPYVKALFPPGEILIAKDKLSLELHFDRGLRKF